MDYLHFENSYLAGYKISESVEHTLMSCLTLCLISDNCRSVNVWRDLVYDRNVICQLNWYSVYQTSLLQNASNVQYYAMVYETCADIKRERSLNQDGEYYLRFGQHYGKVYCHNMTDNPSVSGFCQFNHGSCTVLDKNSNHNSSLVDGADLRTFFATP